MRAIDFGPWFLSALVLSIAACGDDDGDTTPAEDASASDGSTTIDLGPPRPIDDDAGRHDAGRDAGVERDLGAPDMGSEDPLPTAYHFDGSALGASDDDRVTAECMFYGDITMLERREDGFSGVAVGEVFRFVTVDGMRYEFQALIGGPVDVSFPQPDQILARLVGDQSGPEVKPFWRALEEISADETEPDHWAGEWTCASLEIDMPPGFVDTFLEVPGAWTLVPLE